MRVAGNLTELVGNTPLLELGAYAKRHGLKASVVAKLEYFNPLSSAKDRVALAMVEDAERRGHCHRQLCRAESEEQIHQRPVFPPRCALDPEAEHPLGLRRQPGGKPDRFHYAGDLH